MGLTVGCVVVHHRNFPDVLETVEGFIGQGVASQDLVVVDNSEDGALKIRLADGLPENVLLLSVANEGYGSAANAGIDLLLSGKPEIDAIIVASHEVALEDGCVSRLLAVLKNHPTAGAVGPLLVNSDDRSIVWSAGGSTSLLSGRPKHYTARQELGPYRCDWLDGAIVAYRAAAIKDLRFDPLFVMYFEETDLHFRMRAAGYDLWVEPNAVAAQDTNGIPPYYAARNTQIFMARHGTRRGAALATARSFASAIRSNARHNGLKATVRDFARGLRDGRALT